MSENAGHLPTIHGNGTTKRALVDALASAVDAIHDAGDKLKLTAPNGRDYYVNPGSMDAAEDMFRRRMLTLYVLAREIEADMMAIDRMKA